MFTVTRLSGKNALWLYKFDFTLIADKGFLAIMMGAGGVVTNARGGQLGIVLNVREIARTANGDILSEYEAVEVGSSGQNGGSGAYGGINAGHTRPVHASTLTAAQAREGGISNAEYQKAREAANHNGAGGTNDAAKTLSEMSDGERAEVARLQARDSAVKQEEKGHAAAAGQYASAPQYQYTIGPDGKAYAIGGHVDVSINSQGGSAGNNRSALAALQNAALSPNAPSGADMAAFRQATMALGASAQQQTESGSSTSNTADAVPGEISPTGETSDAVASTAESSGGTNAIYDANDALNANRRQQALDAYDQAAGSPDRAREASENESLFAAIATTNANSRYERGSFFNSSA